MDSARAQRILSLTLQYVSKPGITGTSSEKLVEEFQEAFAKSVPYFLEHPEHWGFFPIQGDAAGRKVYWLLRKGQGDHTVILLHHGDVVEISDYGALDELAFSPMELEKALLREDVLGPEALADLKSGQFLFGRGVADMKGGGAIHLALLEEYCQEEDFKGNVLVLAVPDEENLSAGMRAALYLMEELSERFSLDYRILINSESHLRKEGKPVLSMGAVGKRLYFVYVRGRVSHIGRELEGFSPIGLLGRLMSESEQRPLFFEQEGEEVSPLPVWVFARDAKETYDASMAAGAFGCLSVLSFKKSTATLTEELEQFLRDTSSSYVQDIHRAWHEAGLARDASWSVDVQSFSTFAQSMEGFDWRELRDELEQEIRKGAINYVEGTRQLMERMMNARKKETPLVVYGLVPPLYPGVCSADDLLSLSLLEELQKVTDNGFASERYYAGISDLSYTRSYNAEEDLQVVQEHMPFFGGSYRIAFDLLERWQIPGWNIGPLGIDFHKRSERVLKEDLLVKAPVWVDRAVRFVLAQEEK